MQHEIERQNSRFSFAPERQDSCTNVESREASAALKKVIQSEGKPSRPALPPS